MRNFEIQKRGDWIWIQNMNIKPFLPFGKYLFFSADRVALLGIARDIMHKFNLSIGKIAADIAIRNGEFVMCLYDARPRFKHELRDYANGEHVKYRHWKEGAVIGIRRKDACNQTP